MPPAALRANSALTMRPVVALAAPSTYNAPPLLVPELGLAALLMNNVLVTPTMLPLLVAYTAPPSQPPVVQRLFWKVLLKILAVLLA